MCLIKTHRFPKISKKPIKCYKVVTYAGKNKYCTLHIGYRFLLGDVIKSGRHWIFGIFNARLNDEVVHAYEDIPNCETAIHCIECEIPPFTPYWIGILGDIGAARIKTIKEILKK